MAPMDIEKTMQFILEQQAQTGVRLDQVTVRLDQLTAAHQRLAEDQLELARLQSQQQGMIGSLVTIVGELAQTQKRTDQRVNDLTENMKGLIKVVDDLVRRDGRRPS